LRHELLNPPALGQWKPGFVYVQHLRKPTESSDEFAHGMLRRFPHIAKEGPYRSFQFRLRIYFSSFREKKIRVVHKTS
jgi:hypothetical protein